MRSIIIPLIPLLLAAAADARRPDTVSTPDPVPGAIARWDFNEGQGDTLHDRTGNGHHGIIHGARWVAGKDTAGKALDFDGKDWVEVPGDSQTHVNSFTFSIWLRQSGNSFRFPIVEFQEPNALVGVHLTANTSGWGEDLPGAFYANLRPHDASASQPGEVRERNLLNTGAGTSQGCRWNHIVLAFDQATLKARIHVNGRLQAQRTLQPFTPRTTGFINFGIRSPTSVEWGAGEGLTGQIDDAALYGRALTEAEILTLYDKPPVEPKSIHLGIKTHNAKAGDTLWVPVYISSEGKDSLSSLQFRLELDTTVAELLDVKVDTTVAPDWQLTDWNRSAGSPVPMALAGTSRLVGAKEGELIRLKLKVVPDARNGASTMLTLTDISADEGRVGAVSHTPGRIFVFDPSILYGDVNGDRTVDTTDARIILLHVVGRLALPSAEHPNFTVAVADVSGNGDITSYDAALVLMYGLGIIDEFPVERKTLAKRAAQAASLTLGAPVRVEGNLWRYRIQGAGLEGLIAGEIQLQTASPVVSIARVGTAMVGIRVSHRLDASGRLDVALAANRRVAAGTVDFLEVDAVHENGSVLPGLSFKSAWLNEGRLTASGMESKPLAPLPGNALAGRTLRELRAERAGSLVRLSVPGERLRSVEFLDSRGRRVLTRRFEKPVQAAVLARSELPAGLLVVRVVGEGGRFQGILAPAHP